MHNTVKFIRDDRGATLVSFGALIALVGVVAIAALAVFGGQPAAGVPEVETALS